MHHPGLRIVRCHAIETWLQTVPDVRTSTDYELSVIDDIYVGSPCGSVLTVLPLVVVVARSSPEVDGDLAVVDARTRRVRLDYRRLRYRLDEGQVSRYVARSALVHLESYGSTLDVLKCEVCCAARRVLLRMMPLCCVAVQSDEVALLVCICPVDELSIICASTIVNSGKRPVGRDAELGVLAVTIYVLEDGDVVCLRLGQLDGLLSLCLTSVGIGDEEHVLACTQPCLQVGRRAHDLSTGQPPLICVRYCTTTDCRNYATILDSVTRWVRSIRLHVYVVYRQCCYWLGHYPRTELLAAYFVTALQTRDLELVLSTLDLGQVLAVVPDARVCRYVCRCKVICPVRAVLAVLPLELVRARSTDRRQRYRTVLRLVAEYVLDYDVLYLDRLISLYRN